MRLTRVLLLLAAAATTAPAFGQAVQSREPTGTHIFPAGARRGTTVTVRAGGECFPPGMSFHLIGDGVKAPAVLGAEVKPRYEPSARRPPRDADAVGAATTYPREWASEIAVAADAAPGMRFWRVSGSWGGTRPLPFVVGDLPEFIETEPNSKPELAERVTLPVVVNGQIAGERDEDYFVFAAKAGEVVVCDVMAARLNSPLDPVVTITDAKGGRVTVQEVRSSDDPVAAFRVPATGDYRLHLANLGFAGGPAYVYRATVSTAPHAPFAFPPADKAGETREVEFLTLTGTDSFRAVKEKVAFPPTPGVFYHRGTPLLATAAPELTDGANNVPDSALALSAPATVCGRFLTASEEDWYELRVKKGEVFALSCEPFPRDSAALPVLAVLRADGTQLATASAATSPDRTAELDWTAPADGTYRVRLRDLQHGTRGGPEFVYRLSLTAAKPDFALRLEPDSVNVVQGGKTEIDLVVRRSGGFAGAIDLVGVDLPDDVSIAPARVPEGVSRLKIALAAKPDTRPADVAVGLTGRATIAGTAVERRATVSTFGQTGNSLRLTVQHKPVFRLTCSEAYQYAHRGSVYPYGLKVERLGGFDGPITLQLCDRQVQDLDGVEVVEAAIPPGAAEASARIYFPETMFAGVQHHSRPYVQGYATFTDAWGQKQTLLAVCDKRCMVRTMPPVAKLRAVTTAVEGKPGGVVECKLVLDRTPNFTGAATIELLGPPGAAADAVQIKEGETEATVRVRLGDSFGSHADAALRFRATGKMPAGATLATEATVPVAVTARPDDRPAGKFPDYRPVAGWPQLPPKLELGPVSAVATDSQDRVYVAHRGARPVLVFDRDGKFLRSWGDDHIKTAHGLRIDPAGNVWVTDIGDHLVMKFDPEGKLLLSLGKKGQAGDKPDQFDRPTDVAVTPGGDFYVTDGYGNSRVLRFDRTGKLLRQWGTKGKGEGEFNLPHSIVLDAKGRVYVGDRENDRVQVFDPDGKFLEQWKESGAPFGLFLAGDRTFVADGRANLVRVLGPDGKPLGRFGEKGTAAAQFQMPHMLCVDSRGDVYVAEVTNKRIQKFTAR